MSGLVGNSQRHVLSCCSSYCFSGFILHNHKILAFGHTGNISHAKNDADHMLASISNAHSKQASAL